MPSPRRSPSTSSGHHPRRNHASCNQYFPQSFLHLNQDSSVENPSIEGNDKEKIFSLTTCSLFHLCIKLRRTMHGTGERGGKRFNPDYLETSGRFRGFPLNPTFPRTIFNTPIESGSSKRNPAFSGKRLFVNLHIMQIASPFSC